MRRALAEGDEVSIQPGNLSARIRRLETSGNEVGCAQSGQRLAVNLVVKDGGKISRGWVVLACKTEPAGSIVMTIEADGKEVAQLRKASGKPVRFYHGTAEAHGQLRWVEETGLPGDSRALIGQIVLLNPWWHGRVIAMWYASGIPPYLVEKSSL